MRYISVSRAHLRAADRLPLLALFSPHGTDAAMTAAEAHKAAAALAADPSGEKYRIAAALADELTLSAAALMGPLAKAEAQTLRVLGVRLCSKITPAEFRSLEARHALLVSSGAPESTREVAEVAAVIAHHAPLLRLVIERSTSERQRRQAASSRRKERLEEVRAARAAARRQSRESAAIARRRAREADKASRANARAARKLRERRMAFLESVRREPVFPGLEAVMFV